jgi:hypothetical protein
MSQADEFLKYLQTNEGATLRKGMKDATLASIEVIGAAHGYIFSIEELTQAIPKDPGYPCGPTIKASDWKTMGPGP